MFANETFSATEGTIISATTTSTLVKDILEMAEKATEESFVEEVEKIIREDEVSAGKFWNINTNNNYMGQRRYIYKIEIKRFKSLIILWPGYYWRFGTENKSYMKYGLLCIFTQKIMFDIFDHLC